MGNIDFVDLLFGFQGRINRAKYWIAVLIYFIAWIVVGGLVWFLAFGLSYILGAILFVLLLIVSIVSGIAVGIKRLHDRDKSGWWLLVFYLAPAILDGIGRGIDLLGVGFVFSIASFAITIWAFVELGCLRGTVGTNQYGPDPLQGRA
jgi:uncharacterized membrane protein YhaH (DUF805 family)